MKSDLLAYLFITIGFLPGEMGITLVIMLVEFEFNPWLLLAWLGIWMTANFFLTSALQAHVTEQKKIEKQQERIENS